MGTSRGGGSSSEDSGGRLAARPKRGAPVDAIENSMPGGAKRGKRSKEGEEGREGGEESSSGSGSGKITIQKQSGTQFKTSGSARLAGDKGPLICHHPLSGPWISSHAVYQDPVVIKRPYESLDSKWGMNIFHDVTQWGEDWAVVMVSSPGPQKTLSIGDIVLGVNGVPLSGKTFTQAVSLLKDAGIYCHLAIARFQGCMTMSMQVRIFW